MLDITNLRPFQKLLRPTHEVPSTGLGWRKRSLLQDFGCRRGWRPRHAALHISKCAAVGWVCVMDRDGSGDQEDVVEWLGLTAGLHEDVVTEATPRLRSEHVYVVGDLALLEQEGGLGDVFTTRVSARKVRDALRLRSGHQPATVGCPAGGRSRAAEEAVLNGTLLGSLPAQAEPETAAGLTHEHVVSYGAQDAVDCSTRPPDPPQLHMIGYALRVYLQHHSP